MMTTKQHDDQQNPNTDIEKFSKLKGVKTSALLWNQDRNKEMESINLKSWMVPEAAVYFKSFLCTVKLIMFLKLNM